MAIQNLCLLLAALVLPPQDWMRDGHRAMDEGRVRDAAVAFRRALAEGTRLGLPNQDLVRIRVALATAFMEARDLRAAASVLREGHAQEPVPRAELLNARGSLDLMQDRISEAATELGEARELVRNMPDATVLAASILHNLSGAELREGLYNQALSHAEEALKLLEKSVSSDHPNVIRARASLGTLEYLMGEPRRARASMEAAIASAERAYGVAHPLVADLLDSNVVILERLKRKKEAKAALERARCIRGGKREPVRRMTWDVREALLPGQVLTR